MITNQDVMEQTLRKQPLSRQRPGTGKRPGTGHARQSLDSRVSFPRLKIILRPPNRGDTIKISTTRVSIPGLKFVLRPPNRGDTIKISSCQTLVPKIRDEISETNRNHQTIWSHAGWAISRFFQIHERRYNTSEAPSSPDRFESQSLPVRLHHLP